MPDNPFRQLPAVHQILESPGIQNLNGTHAHEAVVLAIRQELDHLRQRIKDGAKSDESMTIPAVIDRVRKRLTQDAALRIRAVINATGVVLHTNLGRSPIAEIAAQAAYEAAHGYLNLELDLTTGKRSSRQNPIREALCPIIGAESATAVNNCAAATVITLRALAQGKEVIVSRGQLIEIGGSFRIPEIMAVSGATLKEVGTTNITRISDYEKAIGSNTGLLMRVHTSNYRVRGFTKEASLEELVQLGKKHNLPVVDDVGSGALFDYARFGLPGEPVVPQSIQQGADLVLFSGDKLLGGPQAGLIAGKKPYVQKIEKDPLMRAFRLDKMTLAALEATLKLYRHLEQAIQEIPTLRLMSMPISELRTRTETFAEQLKTIPGLRALEVRADQSFVGGGSLPDQPLPTIILALTPESITDAQFAERLRMGTPAVMTRVQSDQVLFDLRTVFEHQEANLCQAIRQALQGT